MGRWRGWLAAYRASDFVERHCHYGAMAMGAPLGVVFYHWGGLQALALIIMGVALVAILLAIPRPTVKSQ